MSVKLITFPHISKLQSTINKLLNNRVSVFSLNIDEKPWDICLQSNVTDIKPCLIAITLIVDDYQLKLNIQNTFLQLIIPNSIDIDSAIKLPKDLFDALMIANVQPILNKISSELNVLLKFHSLSPAENINCKENLAINITTADLKTTAYINITNDTIPFIKKLPLDTKKNLPKIPFFLRFEVARSILTKSEIQELELEDIVFFQKSSGINKYFIRLNRHVVFLGEVKDSRLTIKNRVENMDISSYNDQEEDMNTDAEIMPADMDVNVIFEAGSQQINAAELSQLSVGYIFELNSTIKNPIKVIANGKHIADSELVEVDGKLGARITKLY